MELDLLHRVTQDVTQEMAAAAKSEAGVRGSDASSSQLNAVNSVFGQLTEQVLVALSRSMSDRAQLAVSRCGEAPSDEAVKTIRNLTIAITERAAECVKIPPEGKGKGDNVTDAIRFVDEIEVYVGSLSASFVSSKGGKRELLSMLAQLKALLSSQG